MPKNIIWSHLAENDVENIPDYLDKNWERKVASNFIALTENVLNQISINPKQHTRQLNKRAKLLYLSNVRRD